MENNGRLDDGETPPAQTAGTLGSTEQEGGNATKDVYADELNAEFGSGNRQHITTGATPETRKAEEGLDEDAANLGSEVRRAEE